MANPGVGNKFASVNLNKSYGQQQYYQHHHNNQHHSSNYGSSRTRPVGSGGGMVVLSRPRSSQKATGPKLSVPPPLNLPSLRKEHEKFDSLGSGGGPAGGGIGSGPRPSSSGMGWTKPAAIALHEKEGFGITGDNTVDGTHPNNISGADQGLPGIVNGVSSSSNVYTPPSARSAVPAVSVPSRGYSIAEKAMVLRGEDFPSLQAALPASGPEKKQNDGMNQKQKHALGEDLASKHRNGSQSNTLVDMRPQSHLKNNTGYGFGGSVMPEKVRKQDDFFPGQLPLVRLNPRSDWADDERDTGYGLTDRGRDNFFSKSEAYWDMDFDFPRPGILPQKPGLNLFDRRGLQDNEAGKISSSEVSKVGTYGKDVRVSSREGREGNSWRVSSPLSKEGFGVLEAGSERIGVGTRPSSMNMEATKEPKYIPLPFRDNAQDDAGRRDLGYVQGGRLPWNNKIDSFGSRGPEWNARERYSSEHNNRYRGDGNRNTSASKSSFSMGVKGLPINDPILNFGREKRPFSKSEKPYIEDPFIKEFGAAGFDGWDPFLGGLVGLVKKKKDVLKQTDFHDPVRESFEAELERVQKMQEQERQRMIEEHERAMELARREEEERVQLAREQEQQQRRLEEERLEAIRRAEQERLESMKIAEEQRLAREDEKRRILLEEERTKHAAKQKLLELEEKIAKRHTEAAKSVNTTSSVVDEKVSGMVLEKDASKVSDVGDWEDSERMVERMTTSASSDSSGMNRAFDMKSRSHFPREGYSAFLDRGKALNSWKRDVFENGNSSTYLHHEPENGHRSPKRDMSVGGRIFPRKELYGVPGFIPPRTYHRGGVTDTHMDDFSATKGQRWSISGDGDHNGRNAEIESDFHDNLNDRFGDSGWGHSRSRGNPYSSYPERMYQNPEADGLYSYGRSRYAMRQPRVLPPPPMNSMLRNPCRAENDHPAASSFSESEMQYIHVARNESSVQTMCDGSHQENIRQAERIDFQQEHVQNEAHKMDRNTTRCDSQSSLSVSSPPDSPVHLSHDDLDESGDAPALSGTKGKDMTLLDEGNESATSCNEAEKGNMMSGCSVISSGDDEDWTIENGQQLQEQEEYDEDEDGYNEEDEVHDGEDENISLVEEKGSSDVIDNLVLGFNEGVEVGMPNDEIDRSSSIEENKFVVQQISAEVQGSFDEVCSDEQVQQPVEASAVCNSSKIFQETEKAMQDLVIQPKNSPQASSDMVDSVDLSSSSALSSQPQVPSSSGQTVMSSDRSILGQPEVPVKLQFGLFSGPSLIPSPVPAIQIGSIQMPLHLHAPVGPSLTHMHPSQSPLFQFGQLRFTSPISQGVLPLAPQSMSFVQNNVPSNFPLNQNVGGPLPIHPGQETTVHNLMKSDVLPVSMESQPQPGLLPRNLDISHVISLKEGNSLPTTESSDNTVKLQQSQGEASHINDNTRTESSFGVEDSFVKSFKALPTKELEGQPQVGVVSTQAASKEKGASILKGRSLTSGGRGRRYVFAVKNSGPKPTFQASENSHLDSVGFQRHRRQRTEFRVWESADKRQATGLISSGPYQMDDKSNNTGRGARPRSISRRAVLSNKQPRQTLELEGLNSRAVGSRELYAGNKADKGAGNESLRKIQNISHSGQDVDAPLHSGIVRIFEQPGIEGPSDDDDFIEVRSKRQMLNDRREQREKEIKAKSRVSKIPRKFRFTSQSNVASSASSKIPVSVGTGASNSVHSDFVGTDRHGLANAEVSAGFNSPIVSQPLLPIGTPAVKSDSQIKFSQTGSLSVASGGGKNLASGLIFETKNNVLDNPQTSLGSWGTSGINLQVMALTQIQLDEAMKPAQFDSHSFVGDPSKSAGESSLPSSSILTKDKSFSLTASSISSLLTGEKIQFGAVTSPTILPPSSCAVSHGIGLPGPCRSNIKFSHSPSAAEIDCSLFFEKDKLSNESCAHLVDCEAEAAASAIAVAAISSDEIVGNGLGTVPVSSSDSKNFGAAGITAGVSGDQQLSSQSRAEESLSVALPADLSVETPPISLWPPLPSPQNSSSQMLAHVPVGPASHFPLYEMNPMLGGPIFAFGAHDESGSNQTQLQKSNASVLSPPGTWQHHSGVDSFYGPPAGFTGPFISHPGSISGVQGPPHMVLYNHFAPVGQFGQVGLSFMGTTYIPSGKQPDWKHNPASSPVGVSEGETNSLNMVSALRTPTNMPTPIQHLAPGSPLLPMASPLAMFDVSPFQSSPDMSVQARWSHVHASPLQSVAVSMPLQQQQADGVLSSQFNHGPGLAAVDQSLGSRFQESRTTTPSDNQNFTTAADSTVTQLPDELGFADSTSSTSAGAPIQSIILKSQSAGAISDTGKTDALLNGVGNNNSNNQSTNSAFKIQPSQKSISTQHYGNLSGYSNNYQRGGGVPQKSSSGGEWPHRRMGGYQGRNPSLGADKGFSSSKMKQIYVAKHTSSGASATS